MRIAGPLLAAAGVALAVWLFAAGDPAAVLSLVHGAAAGLVLAGLTHALPMALNARAWQAVLPAARRPHLLAMTRAVWVRESVNALLPVARIGGEVASYRLVRRGGVRRAAAAASLMVDMALSVLSQAAFALVGVVVLLVAGARTELAGELLAGLAGLAAFGMVFILVQRARPLERVITVLNRLAGGRLGAAIGDLARIDRAVRNIYRRRGAIARCALWQLAGWLAGSVEVWLALHFLGHPVGVAEAVAIESLVQAASSAAFLVPGALGVQEGAFVVIGAALGLDGTTALALAAARRLRDIVVFFPGLLAWQALELDAARGATAGEA